MNVNLELDIILATDFEGEGFVTVATWPNVAVYAQYLEIMNFVSYTSCTEGMKVVENIVDCFQ